MIVDIPFSVNARLEVFHTTRGRQARVLMGWKHQLGESIKEARDSALLTQAQLARSIGVSRQMIARYEAGLAAPSLDVLARIAQVTGLEQIAVHGIKVDFSQSSSSQKPKVVVRQLKLPFGKAQTFTGATVEIIPRKGRLVLTAVIPA